jgi:hypothetical protein
VSTFIFKSIKSHLKSAKIDAERCEIKFKIHKIQSKFCENNLSKSEIPIQKVKNLIQEMKNTIWKASISKPKVDFPNLLLGLQLLCFVQKINCKINNKVKNITIQILQLGTLQS